MKNGELMQKIFPDGELQDRGSVYWFSIGEMFHEFSKDWWNDEYKNPVNNTDVKDDTISRKEAVMIIQKYGVGCFDPDEFSPEECERFVISKLNSLPPASSQESRISNIRAKIEKKLNSHGYISLSLYNKAINDVLQIIDIEMLENEKQQGVNI